MAIRRILHLCRVQVKELLLTPTLYAFLCLLFVYCWHLNAAARRLQDMLGLRVNAWGYTAGVFSEPLCVLVFALGCVAVFSDMPLMRENAVFESARCSKNTWALGRVAYVLLISLLYTLVFLLLCVFTSGGSLSLGAGWGKILNTLANGYLLEGVSLPVELSIAYTTVLRPAQALLLFAAMGWGAAALCGLTMLWLSLLSERRAALFLAGVMAMLDFIAQEKLPHWVCRFSPFSFMRLTVIKNSDMPYYPTAAEAGIFLAAGIVLSVCAVEAAVHCSRAFSNKLLKEQF